MLARLLSLTGDGDWYLAGGDLCLTLSGSDLSRLFRLRLLPEGEELDRLLSRERNLGFEFRLENLSENLFGLARALDLQKEPILPKSGLGGA